MKRLFRFAGLGSRFAALTLLFLSGFNNISAQCFEADGVTIRPSFYNIMIALDDSWVDNYSDLDAARIAAELQVDNTIAALNNPSRPFGLFFNLTFKKIFFPNFVGGPDRLSGESNAHYSSRLDLFYIDKYPCVRYDCLIYFTSDSGTDHATGVNGVVITPGDDVPSMAHEIGHTLGLSHLGSTCCQSTNTMMCAPPNATASISPMNAACGFTVGAVNNAIFTPSRCASVLAQSSEEFEDDLECPPTASYVFSIMQDNPNPVVNCKEGGDINEVSITLFNGYQQQADLNLRGSIGSSFASFIEFVQDPELDFNCIKTESNRTEFWITDPNCGNETQLSICGGCSVTVKFKVKYLGGISSSAANLPVTVYVGTDPSSLLKKTFQVTPYKTASGTSFSSLYNSINWSTTSPIHVTGNLLMNPSAVSGFGTTYNFGVNKKILFGPGASLEIAPGNTVKMPNVQIEGCSTMWKGITVRDGATLEMNMASSVADAQFAVNVQKGGTADIESCKFVNNNFGIHTAPEGTGTHNITALGNHFATTEAGLKPTWGVAQQPAPGEKGFAGIHVKDLAGGLSLDKDPELGFKNEFSNLHYGIMAENTDVTVRDATFMDIVQETRPSGYPGPSTTGNAIYVSGGNANIKGNYTGIVPGPLAMDNCHTGVNTRGGSITVEGCEMSNMTNGVAALGGTNKSYAINWNKIGASDRGISVFYQSGIPGASNITNNVVNMAGNSDGVGIAAGGQEMFPQNEGLVANNHVTVAEGATGIQIGVANKLKVTQNNVSLSGSGTLFGIKVEGGDRNTLNCNIVTNPGSGNNAGIYAIHAGRASVLCNVTDGPARGLHFEGMLGGRNKADVAGNSMESNTTAGLLLGTDAVIGGQPNRGNMFDGTGALAATGAQLHSLFIVDAAENPDFLPFPLFPPGWFQDISNPVLSYQCAPGTTCPLPPVVSDYSLDIATVKGQLGGTTYLAANQWLAQRRFYELVQEEGNPYPGNTDVSTFLSQAQTNGIAGYANVQVGIRSLGAMTALHRAATAASLLTLNGLLADSAIYAVNEKSVNQIFLQTLALGNTDLTETQITVLEGIAEGCPLSDGEAVLRARTMLEVLQGAPVQYDDAAICAGAERANPLPTAQSVRVYPNPAKDVLTVDYQGIGDLGSQFLIFNAQGQIVREIALSQSQGSVQITLGGLPDGIYWYAVPGLEAGKVIVQH